MEVVVTKDNFQKEVLDSDLPVLVDFWATWCPPCRMLSPVVSSVAEKLEGKLKVGKVDVDDQQELAAQFGIMSIPTLILFKNGQIVKQTMGAMPEAQLMEFLGL
jgi:thioredoxin 1